ncbi:response regulator [Pseudonocardia acidicola]|uniref:Transcriptional regulatory protein n=1 Tax=Pseudonocardia acidicola TaxID=2724939 RepID=A0ABX1SKY9_9PSEU|nr:response regulator [Pseudonocardia acidicola]NMI00925.1 response regulator [Pseudonocardia acidicola]
MRTRDIDVLVVDDDFRVAALHADFVGRVPGFAVVASAHTARAALEVVRTGRPDLVLLDLYLPDEDGLTLLSRLREGAGPHPDVIAVTAARDMPSVRAAMQRGVVQYLVKPFPFRALADRLEAYRTLWMRSTADGEVEQGEVDRLFGLMRSGESTSSLPKGCSEATMALVRAAFDSPGADLSASEIAERVGISRATAQRYLAHLAGEGKLVMHLRYGSAGRPEHRFRRSG